MLVRSLELLHQKIISEPSMQGRMRHIDWQLSRNSSPDFLQWMSQCSLQQQYLLKQLIVIGQAGCLAQASVSDLQEVCQQLLLIDQFYWQLGGLVGYQVEILRRLEKPKEDFSQDATFHSPSFYDISTPTADVEEAIGQGIEALPFTAEFYPLGGAADRLHLVDSATGCDLPAAKLQFMGKSLFEGLIRDVQAREFLYKQRYGKTVVMPIGIMTSAEKDNHRLIMEMCESNQWFGRPKESFRLFCQPSVPVVDEQGNWIWLRPGKLLLKPGGHGALWKMAQDEGVFSWLKEQRMKQVMVRQVNNPIAGVDYGLLAFLGFGVKLQMAFGFVSCPRLLKAAEGVNVLVEKKRDAFVERMLTNIEYCDFVRYGIDDAPLVQGEPYSRFTCNTNILFARLEDLEQAVQKCPYPGLLVNIKPANVSLADGEKRQISMGRLESTMQNIADVFVEQHPLGSPLKTDRTFVIYNERKKTISTTKKAYLPGGSFQETPEQGFYDLLQASREVLENYSDFSLPPKRSILEMQQFGPECVFLYHPALGPLYSLIGQKVRKGRMSLGSELQLEIAQAEIDSLDLQGSLRIIADRPTESRCVLKNVRAVNKGVDWERSHPFWVYQLVRFESLQISLKGKSELIAEDVELLGDQHLIVEDGMRMIVSKQGTIIEALQ
ncbi:MAG: UTP--glucose-1-phosphate uridylyltransferase [Chlamydiales bacterium]|nr:UTP--glucose-1-phosphate uridylyltransferase [Chlamydiales bacterium]